MITPKNIPIISGIYKITNKTNNKVYIGQSLNLKSRIGDHITRFKKNKGNNHLYNSVQKYGVENFEVQILQQGKFSKTELNEMEITYIRLFKSMNPIYGYNMNSGGDMKNGIISEETRKKMSEASKGRPAWNKGIPNPLKGKPGKKASQETKDKMSKTRKGMAPWNKGKQASKETKQLMSKNRKGRKVWNKGIKSNITPWNKGKVLNDETRKKISETLKGHKLKPESIKKRECTKIRNKFIELIKQKDFNKISNLLYNKLKKLELQNQEVKMTELEKEEFNRLKERCKKSIESIQEHLNSEELTLEEVDCIEEELRSILSMWEY